VSESNHFGGKDMRKHSYEFDTNGLIDTDSEFPRTEERKALKLVEILIDKIIKRLEENSFEPKVQDALKAIQLRQKLVKTSQAEEMFWQALDDISQSEQLKIQNLESQTENLQAQILKNIMRLQHEVKNGMLPVKTITDAFNQGKSQECQLTYQRIGRLLSTMGFQKARAGNNSAILWNEEQIDQMVETFSPSPHPEEDGQIPSSQGGEGTLYSPSLDERG
jgi:phenylalanyl-tRNA synthetase alpha subunit